MFFFGFFYFSSSTFLFCHWLLAAAFLHLQDLARRHLIPGEARLHLQDLARRHLIPAKALILFRLTNKSWHKLKRKIANKNKFKKKNSPWTTSWQDHSGPRKSFFCCPVALGATLFRLRGHLLHWSCFYFLVTRFVLKFFVPPGRTSIHFGPRKFSSAAP